MMTIGEKIKLLDMLKEGRSFAAVWCSYLMMRPFSNKRKGLIAVPTLFLQVIVSITVNNVQYRIVLRINKAENISNFPRSLSFSFQKSKRS